jgi:hypothetical protein
MRKRFTGCEGQKPQAGPLISRKDIAETQRRF